MTRGMRAHVTEIGDGVDGARGRTRGGARADADAGLAAFASARARFGVDVAGTRVVRCDVVTDGVYALFVVRR